MIHWMVFSTLATALFYGLYCLTFRRDRWLQLSRVYLIVTLAFSLAYPLVRLPEGLVGGSDVPERTAALITIGTPSTAVVEDAGSTAAMGWSWLPMALYLVGAAAALTVLAVQIVANVRRMRPERMALLDDETAPCSFFNHIVIGTRGMSDEELQCVLAHEREHVRRHHTEDVLLMRLLCCAAWFNPFAWLMQRELRAVHEYQADESVHSRKVYLGLLYRQATGTGYGHITNKFNSINIKNRIVMMNKQKSRFGAWKALAVLPVAALLMMVGCNNAEAASAEVQPGQTLLHVNYNRTGGKALPFGGIGYNKVNGQWNRETLQSVEVSCSGEGVSRSYGTWEISELQTSKGLIDGKTLNGNERKLIKAIDRKLRKGKTEGRLVRHARAKAPEGTVDLAFVATWNDADIQINVIEEGVPKVDSPALEVAETNPEFPGGMEALYKYLAENIHYPEQAKKDGVQGRVFVRFVIEADGTVTGAEVLRGIGGGCDEEAVHVVKAMPKWKPGTVDGKPVRVQYNLPITFKLRDK